MNMKQFRRPANGHSRTAFVGGRKVGGRGFRLQSKLGTTISLNRLESLLVQARKPNRNKQDFNHSPSEREKTNDNREEV